MVLEGNKMHADTYQEKASKTNLMDDNALYHLLGLMSEVRECAAYFDSSDIRVKGVLSGVEHIGFQADQLSKDMRNNGVEYHYTVESSKELLGELSDCMWYLAMLVKSFGLSLSTVMLWNLQKLKDRAKKNTIKGSGDNR
jgi:phosphoribosyl-ATP pyrophosphohydrolase